MASRFHNSYQRSARISRVFILFGICIVRDTVMESVLVQYILKIVVE
jgi:hypothetical protein